MGNATFIAAQLRLLSQSLAEASALLRGPPLTEADPSWTTRSASPLALDPPLARDISFHLGIQDCALVLWLRTLEPADAPVHFGMKFALAIGTARRLEHDEADQVFVYEGPNILGSDEGSDRKGTGQDGAGGGTGTGLQRQGTTQVHVREKIRVETADPNLLSLSAKLGALGHTLPLARMNLAAVMGEEVDV